MKKETLISFLIMVICISIGLYMYINYSSVTDIYRQEVDSRTRKIYNKNIEIYIDSFSNNCSDNSSCDENDKIKLNISITKNNKTKKIKIYTDKKETRIDKNYIISAEIYDGKIAIILKYN